MNGQRVFELSDCTAYRQTLLAHPPRFVGATFVVLVALTGTAILWAAWTPAKLVVLAQGRIRPMIRTEPQADAAAEESQVSPLRAGRVVEVHVREGDTVHRGELLVRLDTERLDHDLAKQRQSIQAAQDELAKLDDLATLTQRRLETARAKAETELAEAKEAIQRAKVRRRSEIHLAELSLKLSEDVLRRLETLAPRRAVVASDVVDARSRVQEAKVKLEAARLPVAEGQSQVRCQALQLVERQHAVELAELDVKRQQKRAEVEAAKLELANLQWERQQSELHAPTDGTVTSLGAKVGDIVPSGQPVVAIAEQHGFRIDVTVASDDVGVLHVGMPARIKLDAYDNQTYGAVIGRVIFISPDSAIPHGGNARQLPSYTVKIALDADEVSRDRFRGRIKLGMTGIAEIVTGSESVLWLLLRSTRHNISFS